MPSGDGYHFIREPVGPAHSGGNSKIKLLFTVMLLLLCQAFGTTNYIRLPNPCQGQSRLAPSSLNWPFVTAKATG